MTFENIIFQVEKGIAVVTVNRPHKLNALNRNTFGELQQVINRCREQDDIKVVVLTGAGDRVFIAGADVNEISGGKGAKEIMSFIELGNDIFRSLELLEKPVIAAINGLALGGGLEAAMACDIRFAGKNAVFGTPEVNLGIIPGWGGTQRLARLIGMGLAKEMVMSGESIDVQRAYEVGLVNRVVDQKDLLPETIKYAAKLAQKAPFALQMAKYAINYGYDLCLDSARKLEIQCATQCLNLEDTKKAIEAFGAKQKK